MGLICLRLSCLLFVLVFLRPAGAQPNLSGTAQIKLALARLNTLGSVLMIAAHPDDENTAVLAYFARGRHLRTGYLSITRGEGGQNLIGPEQGELLGLLRTQELLAARRIDGAEQFFTRAIDFGFSKSADETLAKWGRERILSDIVWVIRRFRPDVVILRFSGTARDGHGHHQASAILGREAFLAAGDDRRFPEQLRFVEAWQPARLLFNVFSFTSDQQRAAALLPGRLVVDAGEYNPVLGKSYNEIAGLSRSMHRSQGFGAPERRGTSKNFFTLLAGRAPAGSDPFDGIDTTWNRVAGGAEAGRLLARAARDFVPEHPERTIPLLVAARTAIARIRDPWAALKLAELDETVALCAGLWVDAPADRFTAIPGSRVTINAAAINRSPYPLTLRRVALSAGPSAAPGTALSNNELVLNRLEWEAPPDRSWSQPFWLVKPKNGDAYTIDDPMLIGVPDRAPVLRATFELGVETETLALTRPVEYRYVDPARGELTRPLDVAPPVAVNLPETVILFPDARPRKVQVRLHANAAKVSGDLRFSVEAGWQVTPPSHAFRLEEAGDEATVLFDVSPPASASDARGRAVAVVGGREIDAGMTVVAYPHIPPQTVFPPAVARLVRTDAKVLARRVGYVMGAGDEMPNAIRELGCEVVLLTPGDLAAGNLSQFDAIVTGIRAYNVRADLRANQPRLIDYVRNGGTLVVQYNVAAGGPFGRDTGALDRIGPFPLTVGRARVSVEDAPVTFLDRSSPLLNVPNRITSSDFEGWVQERGLYFASEWDRRYKPVVECHDPGESPQPGGMLFAREGKGAYVFTAYSWFRQLPAGTPGAFRIFANILSAGRSAR